ncbi:hypothetical protein AN161_11980 [Lysinibacillus sp. FJAT-14222]|nr:hypothetical protein AN161_11980 [Lysinibacillus sp. FJAT-14222]
MINSNEKSEVDERILNPKFIDTVKLMSKWKNRIELLDGFNDIFARGASLIAFNVCRNSFKSQFEKFNILLGYSR